MACEARRKEPAYNWVCSEILYTHSPPPATREPPPGGSLTALSTTSWSPSPVSGRLTGRRDVVPYKGKWSLCAEGSLCGNGENTSPTADAVPPLPLESVKVASLPREEQAPPLRGKMEFVRGGFCRKENLVCVVGVDVLGDPCDQRDRSAVGVGKES